MNKTVRLIWNIVAWVLVVVVLLLAAAVTLPGIFGVKTMNVLTDSMSHLDPQNPHRDRIAAEAEIGQFLTGALVYVVPVDIEDVKELDVVTMTLPSGDYLTHRAVEVGERNGQPWIYTMGDANNDLDFQGSGIGEDRLVGKVVLVVPLMGLVLDELQSKPIVGILGAALLVVFLFVPDIVDLIVKLWKEDDENNDGVGGDDGDAVTLTPETPEAGE